ncbi:MAG: PliI family lysozyme inhibitor of I-type lysozyme, partial [Gammaproteobacteria bacterium]
IALLALILAAQALHAEPFERELESGGITFHVRAANDSSIGTLEITHTGLVPGPATIRREIDGIVSGAEVADLDADGRPELYVYTTSAGSGSYGDLVGYAVTAGSGLADIRLAEPTEQQMRDWGYRGHDRFRVEGQRLLRSFPVYRPDDANAAPGGGSRELRYRLAADAAAHMLLPVGSDAP